MKRIAAIILKFECEVTKVKNGCLQLTHTFFPSMMQFFIAL